MELQIPRCGDEITYVVDDGSTGKRPIVLRAEVEEVGDPEVNGMPRVKLNLDGISLTQWIAYGEQYGQWHWPKEGVGSQVSGAGEETPAPDTRNPTPDTHRK